MRALLALIRERHRYPQANALVRAAEGHDVDALGIIGRLVAYRMDTELSREALDERIVEEILMTDFRMGAR